MNFATVIKEEILSKPAKERCCKKAFLAGLLRGSGEVFFENENLGLDFSVRDEETAMLVSSYLKVLYNYDVREISVSEDKLNKKDRFVISITGNQTESILTDLKIIVTENGELAVNLKLFNELTKNDCCIRAFFRGLFISTGNCTVPFNSQSVNTRYHLELVFSHSSPAMDTAQKLLQFNVQTKITTRKGKYIVYIKSAEEIKNFIAFIGAPVSVLKLTEYIINGELINTSNRQKNCDLGNVTRQMEASEKQIEAINKIINNGGLKILVKSDLIETANARITHPEETLMELANILGITKSCLNHRLRKIVAKANQI